MQYWHATSNTYDTDDVVGGGGGVDGENGGASVGSGGGAGGGVVNEHFQHSHAFHTFVETKPGGAVVVINGDDADGAAVADEYLATGAHNAAGAHHHHQVEVAVPQFPSLTLLDVNDVLPHKKRISRKLKAEEEPTLPSIGGLNGPENKLPPTEREIPLIATREAAAETTTTLHAIAYNCELCGEQSASQLQFFAHLKQHYEPQTMQQLHEVPMKQQQQQQHHHHQQQQQQQQHLQSHQSGSHQHHQQPHHSHQHHLKSTPLEARNAVVVAVPASDTIHDVHHHIHSHHHNHSHQHQHQHQLDVDDFANVTTPTNNVVIHHSNDVTDDVDDDDIKILNSSIDLKCFFESPVEAQPLKGITVDEMEFSDNEDMLEGIHNVVSKVFIEDTCDDIDLMSSNGIRAPWLDSFSGIVCKTKPFGDLSFNGPLGQQLLSAEPISNGNELQQQQETMNCSAEAAAAVIKGDDLKNYTVMVAEHEEHQHHQQQQQQPISQATLATAPTADNEVNGKQSPSLSAMNELQSPTACCFDDDDDVVNDDVDDEDEAVIAFNVPTNRCEQLPGATTPIKSIDTTTVATPQLKKQPQPGQTAASSSKASTSSTLLVLPDGDGGGSASKAKKHICCKCEREFNSSNALKYHLNTHSGVRSYQCDICGSSFFAQSALKSHLNTHTGARPFDCKHCERKFRQWGDLNYHMISIHSGEKSHQCEFCGKAFARKYSLVVHRRIHTSECNYKCEYCEKTFRASTYLQNHRKIHTGEKPYECNVCSKKFRVCGDFRRHLRIHQRTGNGAATTTQTPTNINTSAMELEKFKSSANG